MPLNGLGDLVHHINFFSYALTAFAEECEVDWRFVCQPDIHVCFGTSVVIFCFIFKKVCICLFPESVMLQEVFLLLVLHGAWIVVSFNQMIISSVSQDLWIMNANDIPFCGELK